MLKSTFVEAIDTADKSRLTACENITNELREKAANIVDHQIVPMLQDVVLEINRVAPKPLDLAAVPLKQAIPVIQLCVELLLRPQFGLEALADVLSTRMQIEELDPIQGLSTIDQLLEKQETIACVVVVVVVVVADPFCCLFCCCCDREALNYPRGTGVVL